MPRRKRRLRRKKWIEEPLTEELLDELLSSPDPKSFISKNEIGQRSLAEYLQKLLEEKGLKRSDVVKAAGITKLLAIKFLRENDMRLGIKSFSWLFPCTLTCVKLIGFCRLRG